MSGDGEKARAIGMNHVALEVDDIDEALDFYGRILAFELRSRSERAAFIDLGDQFINFATPRSQDPDSARHLGLVVDDKEKVRKALAGTKATILPTSGVDFLDPWGNRVQIVEYAGIQYSKTPGVLAGMGLDDLAKTDDAIRQLRDKGMA